MRNVLRQRNNAAAKNHDSHEESPTQSKHLLSLLFRYCDGNPISNPSHSGLLYVVARGRDTALLPSVSTVRGTIRSVCRRKCSDNFWPWLLTVNAADIFGECFDKAWTPGVTVSTCRNTGSASLAPTESQPVHVTCASRGSRGRFLLPIFQANPLWATHWEH